MLILINNVLSRIVDPEPEELSFCTQILSYQPKPVFNRRYGRVEVQQVAPVTLVDLTNNTIPTGLVGMLVQKARDAGYEVNVLDKRERPGSVDLDMIPKGARDYQVEMIEKIASAGRGLIKSATGSGKGFVLTCLPQVIQANTVIVVPEKSLLTNLTLRFKEAYPGMNVGVIGAGQFRPVTELTVATVQSLTSKRAHPVVKKLFDTTEALYIDEVHKVAGKQAYHTVAKFHNAYYRVGFSGTPLDRSDSKSIYVLAATGRIIYDMGTSELTKRGYLTPCTVKLAKYVHSEPVMTNNYGSAEKKCITANYKRNDLCAELIKNAAKPCVAVVDKLSQGKEIKARLDKMGLRSVFVRGEMPNAEREEVFQKVRDGEIDVMLGSSVVRTGIDVVNLASGVVCCTGKSVIGVLQFLGRGLRLSEGKSEFVLYDIQDVNLAGEKASQRWFAKHSKARQAIYKKSGHRVESL